ncbi:4239_t:CDS:2, partial [Acaulospora colombiana]
MTRPAEQIERTGTIDWPKLATLAIWIYNSSLNKELNGGYKGIHSQELFMSIVIIAFSNCLTTSIEVDTLQDPAQTEIRLKSITREKATAKWNHLFSPFCLKKANKIASFYRTSMYGEVVEQWLRRLFYDIMLVDGSDTRAPITPLMKTSLTTSPNVPLSYNTYHDQPDPNGAAGYSQQYNTDQYQSTVYPLVPHSFNTNNDRNSDASYRPPPLTAQTSWAPTFDAASSSRRLGNTRHMGAEEGSRDGYWGSLGLRSNSISSSITDTSSLSSLSSGDRATNFHDPNAYPMHSYDPGLSQGYQYPGDAYAYPAPYLSFTNPFPETYPTS